MATAANNAAVPTIAASALIFIPENVRGSQDAATAEPEQYRVELFGRVRDPHTRTTPQDARYAVPLLRPGQEGRERVPKPARRVYRRKLDGAGEAHLIALACSPPRAGRSDWTLRLLAGRMVELQYIDTLSHETVRQSLKKTS